MKKKESAHINVDKYELKKFAAASSSWWDKNGEFKPLHDINPLRLTYIKSRTCLKNKKILDVGCGGGILSEAMAGCGAFVTGIDMGKEAVKAARLHLEKSGYSINYRVTTVEKLAEKNSRQFDVITCMELIEHVPDPESVIRACRVLLKPGGDIIFATINRNPVSFVFAIVGAEYILRLLPRGTHQYKKLIRPEELEKWGKKEGMKLCGITGMGYNPFFRRYYLTSNTMVNYFMHFKIA